MADRLAIAVSKSVVVGAITKIQSAIDEDARLRQKVKRDLVFITLEFEMMQSFLDDANEEMKNNLVKTWVKHIRQLGYEVEDCVKNVVQLDDKPIFWRRLLPSWMAPPLPLDLAVEDLEHLRARVEDVNNCYRRYHLINESAGSKTSVVIQQQQRQPPVPGASDMLAEARAVTKRQHGAFGDLTNFINKKDIDLQVISLWGAAGDHGTTSIIRETYNHTEVCKNFAYRSWVKVVHPFSPHDFIRSLMAQFYANLCREQRATILRKMEVTQEDLFNEFEKIVTERTYLIVLEGLSNMVDWDAMRALLPDMKNGSWIIVSTQHHETARLCIGQSYQILELKQFSAEHSVCALFKESGGRETSLISFSYEMISKKEEMIQWRNNFELVGRRSQTDKIIKYLNHANLHQVISVWGMAGVGKSALVRDFYYDKMHSSSQEFDEYIWVDVSHPFSLRGFFRSLLLGFESEKDPIQECHKLLEERRCLVVINDLQSVEEWDLIQAALVSRDSKSIIIVITTEASIAAHCTEKREHIFNIKGLEAWAAYDLFQWEVSHKNPLSPLNDYRNIHDQRELIMKCGGFPGVIAATARLLAIKADEWKDAADSLNHRFMHHLETDPEFNNLRGLFHQMHSIILNPPDFLKPCIFYLLIFPRDIYIQQRRLVRRWIAEGYSKQSVEILVEENAKNLFSELVQLNIFQKIQHFPRTNTTKVLYGVNGFIREYITSRQVEEKLVYELGGDCAITTQTRGRHLIILPSWKRDRIVFESSDFSRLWSLTVFGKWESFFISKSMKLLRVLDLEDALGVNDADLDNMVKLLHCLTLLSLRGCREIYHLPKSLGNLSQLQTLDVKNTSIVTLPASITQLHKLLYVRAGTTNEPLDQGHDAQPAAAPHDITSTSQRSETPPEDVDNEDRASTAVAAPWRRNMSHLLSKNKKQRAPQVLDNVNGSGVEIVRAAARRIGNLAALQTLGVVSVSGASGKAILKELKKLIQLRKLGVSGINQKNWKSLCSVISGLVHLESLSVYLEKEEPAAKNFVGDMFSKLPNTLKSLKLYASDGKGQVSPACIKHLDNLRKVHFELTASTQEDIDNLVGLPCQDTIHCLCVKPIQDGMLRLWGDYRSESGFQTATFLTIDCGIYRSEIVFGESIPKHFEVLVVHCSTTESSLQLSGLENLKNLKEVCLKGSYSNEVKQHLLQGVRKHRKRPLLSLGGQLRSS